jgi:hypothetical protein
LSWTDEQMKTQTPHSDYLPWQIFLSPFKIPFYLVPPIVFSFRAHAFFYLWTICRFSWNGTYMSHWRFHDKQPYDYEHICGCFKIVPVHVKCWILLKLVPGCVDGSLHLTVPFMNRLNQTKPATYSVLLCWAFFRDSYFLYFVITAFADFTWWWKSHDVTLKFKCKYPPLHRKSNVIFLFLFYF